MSSEISSFGTMVSFLVWWEGVREPERRTDAVQRAGHIVRTALPPLLDASPANCLLLCLRSTDVQHPLVTCFLTLPFFSAQFKPLCRGY